MVTSKHPFPHTAYDRESVEVTTTPFNEYHKGGSVMVKNEFSHLLRKAFSEKTEYEIIDIESDGYTLHLKNNNRETERIHATFFRPLRVVELEGFL